MDFLFKLPAPFFEYVNYAVTWIGFSTIVGVLASRLVLRRLRPGTLLTILIGIGWAVARVYFPVGSRIPDANQWEEELLSPATFIIGLLGTIGLLLLYRVIAKQSSKAAAE
jgi:uncharacterized membrane protein YeaQ/YmgE (transglycosylase-associated protein family)